MRKTISGLPGILRRLRISACAGACVCLILGLILFFAPGTSRRLLCALVGSGLLLFGAFSLIAYALARQEGAILELIFGVAASAFGLYSLINPDFLTDFLFIALGSVIVVAGIDGIRRALRLRALGYARWWGPMSSAAVSLLIALSVIFFPALYGNMIMRIIGALLIAGAAGDLFSLYRISRI